VFSFALNVNEQRMIAFLTEKCRCSNLRSRFEVHTNSGDMVNFYTVACKPRISSRLKQYKNYKSRFKISRSYSQI